MALHKAGVAATVHEACPAGGADAGAFLVLSPNGMRALDQIDAADPTRRSGFPLHTMECSDARGRRLVERPMSGSADEHGYHHIRRGELYRVLQDQALRRGIPVEHGKRLSAVHVEQDTVRAEFTDGSSADGDFLIGADGVRSTVRAHTDPEARPQFVGERVFYGYSRPDLPTDSERFRFALGRKGIFGHLASPDGQSWWFARIPGRELTRDELRSTSAARWREHLVRLFRKDGTPAASIIGATDELIADNVRDLRAVTWRRGPVLLVGDAAHAMSPAAGQGASVALEDAVVLGKSLRDLPDRAEAFTAYEQLRRERVEHLVAGSRRTSRTRPPNAFQRWRRARRIARAERERSGSARANTPDDSLDWDETVRSPAERSD